MVGGAGGARAGGSTIGGERLMCESLQKEAQIGRENPSPWLTLPTATPRPTGIGPVSPACVHCTDLAELQLTVAPTHLPPACAEDSRDQYAREQADVHDMQGWWDKAAIPPAARNPTPREATTAEAASTCDLAFRGKPGTPATLPHTPIPRPTRFPWSRSRSPTTTGLPSPARPRLRLVLPVSEAIAAWFGSPV